MTRIISAFIVRHSLSLSRNSVLTVIYGLFDAFLVPLNPTMHLPSASLTELAPVYRPNARVETNAFACRGRHLIVAARVTADPVWPAALRARPLVAVDPEGREAACGATGEC
jgi:hypothetical protein